MFGRILHDKRSPRRTDLRIKVVGILRSRDPYWCLCFWTLLNKVLSYTSCTIMIARKNCNSKFDHRIFHTKHKHGTSIAVQLPDVIDELTEFLIVLLPLVDMPYCWNLGAYRNFDSVKAPFITVGYITLARPPLYLNLHNVK